MKNRIKAWLFEAPAILLLVSSFIASIYIAVKPIPGVNVNWATSIFLGIIIILFFIGKFFESK